MENIKDVTFLIALKVDSTDRLNNLDITMQYLQSHFDANIVICEQDTVPHLKGKYNCDYVFFETADFFNRQRGVNLAAKQANTPVIIHYDADILLAPYQILTARHVLLTKQADFIYPYFGEFYDVPKKFHQQIKDTNKLDHIVINECTLFNAHSVGGAVAFRSEVFWEGGGANENFKGLGYEDNEIFTRFCKLGYQPGRCTGPLFHLTHERKDTSFNYNPHIEDNKREFFRIERFTKEQLIEEIKTWSWKK
jgi:predicted glycosyltransferase involved in capsule biosynthesis